MYKAAALQHRTTGSGSKASSPACQQIPYDVPPSDRGYAQKGTKFCYFTSASYTVQVQTSWRVRWETALGRNSCMAPDVPCFSSSNPSALAGTLNSQVAEQIPPAAAPHLLPHHHTAVKMVCLSSATAALVHHRFCPKEIKNVRTYREQGAVACFRRNPPLLSGSQLPLLWWQLFLSTSTMNP